MMRIVRDQESAMNAWVLEGLAMTLLGGVICASGHESTETCVVMTAAIALGVMTGGYLKQKSMKASNAAELQAAVDADSAEWGVRLGEVGLTSHKLRQCRIKQMDGVVSRIRAKKVSKEEALREYEYSKTKVAGDEIVIARLVEKMDARTDNQIKAKASALNQNVDAYCPECPSPASPQPRPVPTVPAPTPKKPPKPGPPTPTRQDKTIVAYEKKESVKTEIASDASKTEAAMKNLETAMGNLAWYGSDRFRRLVMAPPAPPSPLFNFSQSLPRGNRAGQNLRMGTKGHREPLAG